MKIFVFNMAILAVLVGAVPGITQEKGESPKVMPMGKLQQAVRNAVANISPAVVGLRMSNGSSGSGVIISEEGLIMTAAHVTHPPGKTVQIAVQFPDGRRGKGEKLGAYYAQDASFARVVDEGKKWPFVPIAKTNPRVGDWVIAMGHTAGFNQARTPPVRVGQVLSVPKGGKRGFIVSDCSVAGGDSGGPLFNLDGELIGINSSIGRSLRKNLHVPIEVYHTNWDRMVSGEEWGRGDSGALVLGVRIAPKGKDEKPGAVIDQIFPNSPAEKAGLVPGDRILTFDGKDVKDGDGLVALVKTIKPGAKVEVEVERPVEAESNPAAEVDPDVEPEMETVKLTVEFPGKKAAPAPPRNKDAGFAEEIEELHLVQFDLSKLRRPGSRPGRSAIDIGLFTRPAGTGIGVTDVVKGLPAEKAGLRRGDFIANVDGVKMTLPDDLKKRVQAAKPGDVITVCVRRGGKDVNLKIRLPKAELPEVAGPKRVEKDPNALRDLLADLREGKVDPEEVRKRLEGRMPNLEMAPGYKPVVPRGAGPVLDQFKPVASTVQGSVVEMISGYKSAGLGTVVGKRHVLAKATELDEKENIRVEMPSGVWADAEKVKTFKEWDLALIKISTDEDLVPVNLTTAEDMAGVGTLVTAFDNSLSPLGWGVIGVASRSLMPKERAFLGVQVKSEEGGGVEVLKVVKGSAAEKSGLQVGDLIRKTKDRPTKDPAAFTKLISSCKPDEEVPLEIVREDKEISLVVKLGKREQKLNTAPKVSNTSRMGTKLSEHRYGYPLAMQHDVPLAPNQMGGPLVSFDGNVIGLNIARAGRTKTFAVPSKAIVELLEQEDLD